MDAHKNFAYSTVTVAPSPATSGTSLTVGNGALFPATPFNATVWPVGALPLASNGEIVRVTNITGNVLTITRAQEGSTARAIVVGDQFAATITNKVLTDIETAIPSTAGLLSAVNVSAGVTSNSLSAVTFSNGNGVSFGLTGSVITGSVATNYQSQGAYLTTAQPVGAYLTTAGLSQDSSKYAGTNGAITGGSITVNTSGVSVNLPAYLTTAQPPGAYLTTAMQSNAVTLSNIKVSGGTLSAFRSDLTFADSNGVSFGLNTNGVITATVAAAAGGLTNINLSAGTTSNNLSAVTFSNSNGISFGLTGSVITGTVATNYQSQGAYLTTAQPVGAYLTTAALSQDSSKYAGINGAITGGSITVNTSGVSVNLPAYLTTAQAPGAYLTTAALSQDSSKYAGTNGAMTGGSITVDTSGISVNLPAYLTTAQPPGAYLTTAMQSNAATISNVNLSAGTTSNNLSAFVFSNSNGVSFGLNGSTVTGTVKTDYQTAGAYLTTAALSQDSSKYAGINGAITGGSITVNTSGVSVNLPAYLTTAMLSNAATISNINISAGTTSNNLSALVFSNSNGVSFGLNGSTVTATAGAGAGAMLSYFQNFERFLAGQTTSTVLSSNSIYVHPFVLPQNISASFIRFPVSMSAISTTYAGTSAGVTNTLVRGQTDAFVLYTQGVGASSLSLQYSTSGSAGWTFQTKIQAGAAGSQNTVSFDITYPSLGANTQAYATSYGITNALYGISTESHTLFTGLRWIDVPFAASLSAGNYWIGLGRSTSSATQVAGHGPGISASVGFTTAALSQGNVTLGYPGAAIAASNQIQPGLGLYTNAAALFSTNSIGLAEISTVSSNPMILLQIIRRA